MPSNYNPRAPREPSWNYIGAPLRYAPLIKIGMETSMEMACVWCRQKLVVRKCATRVVCPSCKCCITVPSDEGGYVVGTQQSSGVCDRMKSFGTQMKTKIDMTPFSFRRKTFPAPVPSLNSPPRPGAVRSSKRALLIGVTYKSWKYKLKGTVGDVQRMRSFLISNYKFPVEYIRVLTEDEPDPRFQPTKENIESSLHWLVDGCMSGDSLVFYYSGHGLRQPDFNDDESDGFDETICPSDFLKAGMILDNDLNSIMVNPLVQGVTLHAIVDACHSGTILDLPYKYMPKEKRWRKYTPPSGVNKDTSGGLAISISACEDNQAAADTTAFTGKMAGAMTYILIDVLTKYPGPTYGDLHDLIEETIHEVNQGCLVNARLLKKLFGGKLSQNPVISSSQEFDVYNTHFKL